MKEIVAIDPMALILEGRAYLIWTEIHHPHVPKVAEIKELMEKLNKEEREALAVGARVLLNMGHVMIDTGQVIMEAHN